MSNLDLTVNTERNWSSYTCFTITHSSSPESRKRTRRTSIRFSVVYFSSTRSNNLLLSGTWLPHGYMGSTVVVTVYTLPPVNLESRYQFEGVLSSPLWNRSWRRKSTNVGDSKLHQTMDRYQFTIYQTLHLSLIPYVLVTSVPFCYKMSLPPIFPLVSSFVLRVITLLT